jgi:hypothetical protein
METLDGSVAPLSGAPPSDYPRVCRLRNLLASEERELAEIRDFNWRVFNVAATADGRRFVAEGMHMEGNESSVLVKAYDGFAGKEAWSFSSATKRGSGFITFDPTGRFLAFETANATPDSSNAVLVEGSSGTVHMKLPWMPLAIGPNASRYAVPVIPDRGCSLFLDVAGSPLVALGIDGGMAFDAKFDSSGNRLAWGNVDGTVTVCDLKEINERLATAKLQW